jgi:hypothetical protein
VSDLPGNLDIGKDRDLENRGRHQWMRRAGLCALGLIVLAAALNVFGQREVVSGAAAPAGSLEVTAPDRVRGGVIFEGTFRVEAHRRIEAPTIVLAPGWLDSVTLNTVEPAPKDETSRPDGGIAFEFPPIPAGGALTLYTQWQVNPTSFGRKPTDVLLLDGKREIARVDRTTTVYP